MILYQTPVSTAFACGIAKNVTAAPVTATATALMRSMSFFLRRRAMKGSL